jgi:hypothetical protein
MAIFVPKTCRVGFQKREDTFAGQLAYVIYYDNDLVLRKQKSWDGWRDHKIPPIDIENKPTSGWVLNKGLRRYSWSHFGSGRSVIRIYDPRGVEFEITPENLIGLLMHTDCSKREIQGDLVYAWNGTELMLLPCSSEDYQEAVAYTKLQGRGKSISAKDLKEGLTYVTKHNEQLTYLGRHMWYAPASYYSNHEKRHAKMEHIFCYMAPEEESYEEDEDDLDAMAEAETKAKKSVDVLKFKAVKSVPSLIADVLTDHAHDQTANWIDAFKKTEESSKIVSWAKKPLPESRWKLKESHHQIQATIETGGNFYMVRIREPQSWEARKNGTEGLHYSKSTLIHKDGGYDYCSGESEIKVGDRSIFFDLYAVFENGLKKKWSR